jgi:hypothetical protein
MKTYFLSTSTVKGKQLNLCDLSMSYLGQMSVIAQNTVYVDFLFLFSVKDVNIG